MSVWKIAGAGVAALGLIAFAHHARAQDDAAPASAAHGDASAAAGPTQEQMAELHRQITTLVTLVYAHADFGAVETHLTTLIRDNPEQFGENADAFAAHVSGFLGQVAEQAAADPAAAAEHTATMLIEAHRPH